jgi:hypothetical protein
MDWIGWKVNQFLVRVASAVPPAAPPGDQPVPRPGDVKIRIEEGEDGARIVFPNTVETRTFAGVGNVLYLGLAMPAVALPLLVRWCKQIQTPGGFAAAMFAAGLLSLIAIAALLNGLTQLFGRRELRITPRTITYRAALLGIGLRTTVPTALVISIGVPPGQGRVPSGGAIAPAQGCVIRTAERELSYSAAVPKGEGPWIMDEVARCVIAVRTSTATQER